MIPEHGDADDFKAAVFETLPAFPRVGFRYVYADYGAPLTLVEMDHDSIRLEDLEFPQSRTCCYLADFYFCLLNGSYRQIEEGD